MTPPLDFDALTEKQREVLGEIAVNQDGGHHRRTLESLQRKGFIVSVDEVLGGRFPVHIKRWYTPVHVHIAWCEWCSLQGESIKEPQ